MYRKTSADPARLLDEERQIQPEVYVAIVQPPAERRADSGIEQHAATELHEV